MRARPAIAALAGLWLAGCAATENPSPRELRPAPLPAAKQPQAAPASAAGAETARSQGPEAVAASVPVAAQEPASGAPEEPAAKEQPAAERPANDSLPSPLPIAIVAGEPIDARAFLVRAWLRNKEQASEILDHLVVERLALLEAEQLGIAITTEQVDARVAQADQALERRLAETGSQLTPEQHIRQKLGLEPELYARELRRETIAQLIAERVVRSRSMEHERVAARLLELEGRSKLEEAQAALAGGEAFLDVAKRLAPSGEEQQAQASGERVVIGRSENSAVAHLAFATPVGQVGGPIEQKDRFLLVFVEQLLQPVAGPWPQIAAQVEASLLDTPIDDLEYRLWRNDAARRYSVDLKPFLELVGQR